MRDNQTARRLKYLSAERRDISRVTENLEGIHFSAGPLAERILDRLNELRLGSTIPFDHRVLERFLDVAFVTSMHHEEGRQLSFRLGLVPQRLSTFGDGSLGPISVSRFSSARPYSVVELCKLVPASSFSRSLLAIAVDADQQLIIDGLLQTGPLWLQAQQGGRRIGRAVFPGLSLHVTGAGSMEMFFAGNPLAAYRKGIELVRRLDIFQIPSLDEQFEYLGRELLDACQQEYDKEEIGTSVDIDGKFFGHLTRQMFKRMIAAIRASNHGGTVLVVPRDMEESLATDNEDIRIRARFAASSVRSKQRELKLEAGRLLRSLAPASGPRNVGWAEYSQMSHPALDVIDTAVFDYSHFIAALTNTDGAVVLSDFNEVLGFGAEILCHETDVREIFRACDVNADVVEQESADQFGTRHRSAYRFVAKYPRAITIVISQDGSVRLVVWRNGRVVYFEHDDLSASTFVL